MKTQLLDPQLDLERWMQDAGYPAYRAGQVRRWLAHSRAEDWSEMTDLPKSLQGALRDRFEWWTTEVVRHSRAEDGTEKLLLQLAAGGQIECVLLRDGNRRTICVSSQVGCAMGCVFCASGLDGVDRNLTAGEIVEQMLRLLRLLPAGERLSHIVMMGMGEPLANLNHVLAALDWASSSRGLGISPRRITISTVGLPAAIERLAERGTRFNLAVSLHAAEEELRSRLVPVNRKIGLDAIVRAAGRYFEVSGRRLTYEYVLLADVNDQPKHARQLIELLRGRPALINVIPYNQVSGLPYRTPTPEAVRRFRKALLDAGLEVQFRQRKGNEIQAACGQLRRSNLNTIMNALQTDVK